MTKSTKKRRLAWTTIVLALVPLSMPIAPASAAPPGSIDQVSVLQAMTRAADWQLAHPPARRSNDWTQAVFYAGLMALAELTPDPKYLDVTRTMGQVNQWRLGPNAGPEERDAADYGVVSTYAQLFVRDRDARMLEPGRALFDSLAANPQSVPMLAGDGKEARDFAMCDSLFFGPPALSAMTVATGDPKYLDFADKWWWKTTEFLYDEDQHLYYRDTNYIDLGIREPNGQKVFWSRGNGWVLAGLARVLEDMPDSYRDRPRYVELFKDMAEKVLALQSPDGYWRASLLDPESVPNPETSGTALFTYALAWGINHALLDQALYTPVVTRGWAALVNAIQPDGMLGWVQRQSDRPETTTQDSTEVYGPGAFLLAGSEVYHLK